MFRPCKRYQSLIEIFASVGTNGSILAQFPPVYDQIFVLQYAFATVISTTGQFLTGAAQIDFYDSGGFGGASFVQSDKPLFTQDGNLTFFDFPMGGPYLHDLNLVLGDPAKQSIFVGCQVDQNAAGTVDGFTARITLGYDVYSKNVFGSLIY